MHTQVAIIGAGPAGLLLSHLLYREGIDCVVLEARSRAYVEDRVRAGVLEQGTVDLMHELGLDQRLRRECMIDEAIDVRFGNGKLLHVHFPELVAGKVVTIYGQQEVVKDLIAARIADGAPIEFEAEVTALEGLDGDKPTVRYRQGDVEHTLTCDIVAGCDGFHGVCRPAIPANLLTTYDHVFPFGWLGVLFESPPIKEMTYANHDRGFALCSRRSPKISRHYIQVAPDEDAANWSDDRFWNELHVRMDDNDKSEIVEGRIFQKGVTPLRAFVSAPMRYGRMFLAGDAAHIVPPTGAKGLNLAAADVRVLARALTQFFRSNSMERLDRYSDTCLRRVWKVVRYSWYMTSLLHRFPQHSEFERNIQIGELDYLLSSRAGRQTIAENYVGLPLEDEIEQGGASTYLGVSHKDAAMDDKTRTELEAAVFRRLVEHLRERADVQNIDIMNLAGFCRNCLSNWMKEEADAKGIAMSKDASREAVYGMPYEEWKAKHQKEASPVQMAALAKSHKH